MRRKTGGLILCAVLLMVFTLSTGCARKSGTVSPTFGEEDTSAAADTGARRDAGEEAGLGRGPGGEFGEGDLPIPQDERARGGQHALEGERAPRASPRLTRRRSGRGTLGRPRRQTLRRPRRPSRCRTRSRGRAPRGPGRRTGAGWPSRRSPCLPVSLVSYPS